MKILCYVRPLLCYEDVWGEDKWGEVWLRTDKGHEQIYTYTRMSGSIRKHLTNNILGSCKYFKTQRKGKTFIFTL